MRRRFRTKGKFMIVSRIYYLTAASKNEAEMVTPFNVMTEEQLNKAWLMMLSPAGGKSYWPASTQRCTTKLITVQTSVLQIGDKETSGVSCFYTSQIWNINNTMDLCGVTAITVTSLSPRFVLFSVNQNPGVAREDAARPCGMSESCFQSGENRPIILHYSFVFVSSKQKAKYKLTTNVLLLFTL